MHPRVLPILAITGLVAACAVQTTSTATPFPPVPPPLAETMPKPPVSAEKLLWQPGHWNWDGAGYNWAPGEWVPAAGHGPLWQPGWWSNSDGGWTWQPAHWTS